ncbi:hypothetical protein K469DRAFT_724126 [Zopfia rhizophila CBS 207.26]|uniref:Uncharacterized protein n=1 Tax=Zopfia rhizophila CBS 207.26 TaxID=1314779 RepID=A0A6A6D7J4_9PEZI|nr:hypothetical protein K469DRAFT_724126 [Zopfia rhizophila CBS 207.26]
MKSLFFDLCLLITKDYSRTTFGVVAQHQNPEKTNINALNKRIQWQINNPDRGLRYILFLIIIGTKLQENNSFELTGNIMHYSLTKSKRVTRSVLINTIICIDLYLLYECLVKLRITKEKRLMINIMALQESYKRQELYKIRWINRADNLANAFIKRDSNGLLIRFIDTNKAHVRIDGWVEREEQIHEKKL